MCAAEDQVLSRAELTDRLRDLSLQFSESQLKRLRRGGLLPEALQRHRAGRRGSETLYPAWIVDQLVLIARLRAGERRFVQLRVLVRWHGGWVQPDHLRASLIRLLEPISAQARELTSGAIDADDRADHLAKALIRNPGRSGASRLVRHRLRHVSGDIQATAFSFATLASGSELAWENHNPNDSSEPIVGIFDRAMGLDRARQDDILGHGPLLAEPESTASIVDELQRFGLFDIFDLAAAVRWATNEQIEGAFVDALKFSSLSYAFDALQALAGPDAGGLGSVSELIGSNDAAERAALVRGMLLMKPLIGEGALENLVHEAKAVEPQLLAITAIARESPHLVPFLGADGASRLLALNDADRSCVSAELTSFAARFSTPAHSARS